MITKDSLKNIGALVLLLFVFEAISAWIGQATMGGIQGWYQTLNRSPLNPPGWVFGAVWTVLYGVLAVATWFIWRQREEHVIAPALMLFGLHMLLNWSWSFVFFEFHMIGLSFFWILAILGLAATLFFIFRPISATAAYLLLPYMGWLGFAAYLSFYIWQNNSLDLTGADAMVPPPQAPEF